MYQPPFVPPYYGYYPPTPYAPAPIYPMPYPSQPQLPYPYFQPYPSFTSPFLPQPQQPTQHVQPTPAPLMSLAIEAPHQNKQKKLKPPADPMKLTVTVRKRKFQATVDKSKQATAVDFTVARFVVKGRPPVNDTIIVPMEIDGRRIDINCIVLKQKEKIIIGRECLQAFGLIAGVVKKPSVHFRLGENDGKKTGHKNTNNKSKNKKRGYRRGNGRAPINIGYSRDLKSKFYPGGTEVDTSEKQDESNQDVLEIHPTNGEKELMETS